MQYLYDKLREQNGNVSLEKNKMNEALEEAISNHIVRAQGAAFDKGSFITIIQYI